jgi:hypothetical protein
MAVEVAESVHTTSRYHHFDLSRADGIFDGSQVIYSFKPLKNYPSYSVYRTERL